MRHRFGIIVLGLLGLSPVACVRANASHCGNQAGDETCRARGGDAVYCSVCVAANDGCVSDVPSGACRSGTGDTVADASGGATTSMPVTTTQASTTGATGSNSESAGPSESTSDDPTETGPGGPTCGDGDVQPPEQCEGGGVSCAELGAGTGMAPCGSDCIYDTSVCSDPPECGDGVVDGGEACDSGVPPDIECEDFEGYVGGDLACTDSCTLDLSQCIQCNTLAQPCSATSCCEGLTCNALGVCA